MSTHEHSRRVHELVDAIKDGYTPDRADVDFLRSFLPELPKQKTLEEIIAHVRDAWVGANDNDWAGNSYDRDISIEDWMAELYVQLQGLKDVPANTPALPAGMRIADHWNYGRVVVSPVRDGDGERMIFCLDNAALGGAGRRWAHENSLTFIDAEPAKPAHPEFLETEADYQNAPEGTIVVADGGVPCHKFQSTWSSVAFLAMKDDRGMSRARRRVLRWGK